MLENEHAFVVLAYKESLYLEACIVSLIEQSVKSNVVIATSTKNKHISDIAEKYNLKIIENSEGGRGIAFDFDFALFASECKYVTIAHQDDVYRSDFLEYIKTMMDEETLIAFSDCNELKCGNVEKMNVNLFVKRVLLFPLQFKLFHSSKFARRMSLSFGNAICCPSVTFNRELINKPLFVSDFKSNVDWHAWEKLSKDNGKFIYIARPLILHRIHDDSTTSKLLAENNRTAEDYAMFKKFWPDFMAKIITRIYKKGEKNNK